MMRLCSICNEKRAVGKSGRKSKLQYQGLDFIIDLVPFLCIECAKDKFIEYYEEYCEGLVNIEDGLPKINWSLFIQAGRRRTKAASDPRHRYAAMKDVLFSLGKLDYSSEGNWEVRDSDGHQYPRGLSFSLMEDAKDYAIALGKDYKLYVREVGKVITVTEGRIFSDSEV